MKQASMNYIYLFCHNHKGEQNVWELTEQMVLLYGRRNQNFMYHEKY
jgi:hypothetical protein